MARLESKVNVSKFTVTLDKEYNLTKAPRNKAYVSSLQSKLEELR